MIIIGIDPGKQTGIVFLREKMYVNSLTTDFWGAADLIRRWQKDAVFAIERPNTKQNWHGSKHHTTSVNIGMALMQADLLIQLLSKLNTEFHIVPQVHKLKAREYTALTGCARRSNQHVRDAHMIALAAIKQLEKSK